MEDATQKALTAHLNDQERSSECHSAYTEEDIANDNDDRDNNEAEDKVPMKVIKL